MPSIGVLTAYPVMNWDGPVQLSRPGAHVQERPGVNGYDVIADGVRSVPFTMGCTNDFESALARANAMKLFALLNGSIVTVVDNDGLSWYNLLVLDVTFVSSFNTVGATGGLAPNGNYILETRFTLQSMATYYL